MRRFAPYAAMALLVVSACSNRPIPTLQDSGTQYRMEAARHWQILANETANKIIRTLNELPPGSARLPTEGVPPIHVALPEKPTQFDRAFRELLITELVDRNAPVSQDPVKGGITVNSTVELVDYDPSSGFTFNSFPGRLTGLGVFSGIEYGLVSLGGAGVAIAAAGAGLAGDALLLHSDPEAEVIITTSVQGSGGYIARKTSIYYIQSDDRPKYANETPKEAPKYPTRKVELSL